jgi:hypothetical protein
MIRSRGPPYAPPTASRPLTSTADGQRHRRLDPPTSVLLPPGAAGHPSTADSSTSRPVVRRSSARRRCTYSRRINGRSSRGIT